MVHAFLTQRPMTLTSEDFNGNEKNNYLQQKLSITGDINAEETKGTFAKSRLCRPLFDARHRCRRCRADVRRRIEKIGLLK